MILKLLSLFSSPQIKRSFLRTENKTPFYEQIYVKGIIFLNHEHTVFKE